MESTALYGYNSVSSQRVPYSLAVREKGGRPESNKTARAVSFSLSLIKENKDGQEGYSAGKLKYPRHQKNREGADSSPFNCTLDKTKTFLCDIRKKPYLILRDQNMPHTTVEKS